MIFDKTLTYSSRAEMPQPHFDDKRTVLAARRVVPLSAVRRKSRLRAGFLLSLSLLLSALLGSGAAVLGLYIQKAPITRMNADLASAPQQEIVSSEAIQDPEIDSQLSTSMSEPSGGELSEQTASDGNDVRQPVAVVRNRRELALPPVSPAPEVVVNQPDPPVSFGTHWEERRLRRVMRPAEGRQASQGNGDIFRIPEIFERKQP